MAETGNFSNFDRMIFRFLTFVILIIALSACTTKSVEQTSSVTQKDSLKVAEIHFDSAYINPIYLPYFLNDTQIENHPFIFLGNSLKGIKKLNFYVKNGPLPNNISQKYTYMFNKNGYLDESGHYSKLTYSQPYTQFLYRYNKANELKKMSIIKYLGILNQPPIRYYSDSTFDFLTVEKGERVFDTTYYYPNFQTPKVIYARSNGKTLSMEFYVPGENTKEEIQQLLSQMSAIDSVGEYTKLMAVYMKNGRPREAYELGTDFQPKNKIRTWKYNRAGFPVAYNEYLFGSEVYDLSIEYDRNNLPSRIVSKKEEFFVYHQNYAQ